MTKLALPAAFVVFCLVSLVAVVQGATNDAPSSESASARLVRGQ
jgi:hypothetical protein